MKPKPASTSAALQAAGLPLGRAFEGAVLKTAIPARAAIASPQRLRLLRSRLAKVVRLHGSASNEAILAAYERRLMKQDATRYPNPAACAAVTGFIGRVLRGEREAVAALNEFVPLGAPPRSLTTASDLVQASFDAGDPRQNPELSEVMRALA